MGEVLPLLEEVNVNSPVQDNGEASLDLNNSNNSTMEIDQSLSPRSGQHDLVQTANSLNSSTRSNDSNASSTRQPVGRSSSSVFNRIFRRALGRPDEDE